MDRAQAMTRFVLDELDAHRMGITRGSLRTKIRTLGINIERSVWADEEQSS